MNGATGKSVLMSGIHWSQHTRELHPQTRHRLKLRATLYSLINSAKGKYCSEAFV